MQQVQEIGFGRAVEKVLGAVGAQGWVHAIDLDSHAETGLGADSRWCSQASSRSRY